MTVPLERRSAQRLDKVFRVLVTTDEAGDQWFVARNISSHGMFVEMAEPIPLRVKVIVRFQPSAGDGCLCVIGRVQNHYYLHYTDDDGGVRALCGVGIRFLRFVPEVGTLPVLLH